MDSPYEYFDNNGSIDGYVATINTSSPLPIELTTFTALFKDAEVKLCWETATEINNYGFEIERQNSEYEIRAPKRQKIGFIQGYGNSNSPKYYSFIDNSIESGKYFYRLKQIHTDGLFKYSYVVEVNVDVANKFELSQNYPNPFNPSTTIEYSTLNESFVIIKVYDVLGKEITTLVNERNSTGNYTVNFNASNLSSGVYFYRMQAGSFVSAKKFILLK